MAEFVLGPVIQNESLRNFLTKNINCFALNISLNERYIPLFISSQMKRILFLTPNVMASILVEIEIESHIEFINEK